MASTPAAADDAAVADWEGVQASPEFGRLRHAVRSFVFPMTIAFLTWYFLYVLMCAFARDFMNTKVIGNITIGLVFGLLQFVTTFGIAVWYSRYANKKMDPLANEIREEMESGDSRTVKGGAA